MIEWEEEDSTWPPEPVVPRNEQRTPPEEDHDEQASNPKPKRCQLNRKDG